MPRACLSMPLTKKKRQYRQIYSDIQYTVHTALAGVWPGAGARRLRGFSRVGRTLQPPCWGTAAGGAVLFENN